MRSFARRQRDARLPATYCDRIIAAPRWQNKMSKAGCAVKEHEPARAGGALAGRLQHSLPFGGDGCAACLRAFDLPSLLTSA